MPSGDVRGRSESTICGCIACINMQHATSDMRHATCNMQHATCDMQHAICYMRHATCVQVHDEPATATCNMRHATCTVTPKHPPHRKEKERKNLRELELAGRRVGRARRLRRGVDLRPGPNMHHATCNMQHATCNMQHATCSMQHATCSMHAHLIAAKTNLCVSHICLLYTSPSPRDQRGSRMPSSA